MTKQEFSEYFKKNKTTVIGIPIIIFIVLLNTFVLKPARIAKKQALLGKTSTTAAATTTASSKNTAKTATTANAPITPPPPIKAPFIPKLDNRIETRFASKSLYPHSSVTRNLFKLKEEKIEKVIVAVVDDETPAFTERPDISYHGFFKVGKEKVAILKLANELTYSKLGSILKRTTFRLLSVSPDKVVVEDTSDEKREFEISLADTSSEKE